MSVNSSAQAGNGEQFFLKESVGHYSLFLVFTETSLNNKSSTFKVKIYGNGKYEGEFENEKKHGKGTYYWTSGDTYTGDWFDDKMAGQGVFTRSNGDRYEGQMTDNKMNGKGTLYWPKGNKYTGDWVNDKMAGQGIFTWFNGNRYEKKYSQMSSRHLL